MRSFSVGNRPPTDPCRTSLNRDNVAIEYNVENHIQKSRSAGNYLKQLLHSQDCQGMCMSPKCIRITSILKHTAHCQQLPCSHPGCDTTKTLLKHSRECVKSLSKGDLCLICLIAKATENRPHLGLAKTTDLSHYSTEDPTDLLIFDEMIETRVPFQPSPTLNPRSKTFSDSDCVLSSTSQPNKKARSKSMTAATLSDMC
jgi:hypothetical protein